MAIRAKLFILLATIVGLTGLGTAAASPELSRAWGENALWLRAELAEKTIAYGESWGQGEALGDDTRNRLERFAGQADGLAYAMDTAGSAPDLACIFRGMSEEVGVQLDALDRATSPAERLGALRRLVKAADDAVTIAEAAEAVFLDTKTGARLAPGTCEASGLPIRSVQYFTEQP